MNLYAVTFVIPAEDQADALNKAWNMVEVEEIDELELISVGVVVGEPAAAIKKLQDDRAAEIREMLAARAAEMQS